MTSLELTPRGCFCLSKFLKKLANLQLAIGLLITIGFMVAIGTFIEQDQNLEFYKENYPEANPLFGFLTWKVITFLSLDTLYNAWWFVVVLFLFGSSLLACTFSTQLPALKTFKIWKFITQSSQYEKLKISDSIRLGIFNTVAFNCNANRYHFFRQQRKGYAYSGLLGRAAPIVVHFSITILLIGSTIGLFGGYTAQEIVPRGEIFHIQNLTKCTGIKIQEALQVLKFGNPFFYLQEILQPKKSLVFSYWKILTD
mgnify:CR=1 FL=1